MRCQYIHEAEEDIDPRTTVAITSCALLDLFFFFFFQAEDGIRDLTVTGVQTCALPISLEAAQRSYDLTSERYRAGLDNYLSVLSSQNQVIQAQGLRAQLRSRRLTFSVDLVRALGGGYSPNRSPG